MTEIEATLQERGKRYGDFKEHARITQNIKDAMRDSPNWHVLSGDKKECLEMIAHKVGRILNGDPEYHDSWHDIVGYTKLVADTLLNSSCNTRTTHIELSELSAQEAKLVQALKYYANPSDYKAPFTGGLGKLYYDCGTVARDILKELNIKGA